MIFWAGQSGIEWARRYCIIKMKSHQLPKDEDALLNKLREGNELAFDYFFHKFYPLVLLFAERIVRDRKLAEEVTQDVFFKVWENKHTFPAVSSLKAFLYVSARNASFNWVSKNHNRAKYQDTYALLEEQSEAPVLHEIIRSEVWAELAGAIESLPAQCRRVIHLLYNEEKKPREIAEELGVTVSTVNNQKARGIMLLKKMLGPERLAVLLTAITLLSK